MSAVTRRWKKVLENFGLERQCSSNRYLPMDKHFMQYSDKMNDVFTGSVLERKHWKKKTKTILSLAQKF